MRRQKADELENDLIVELATQNIHDARDLALAWQEAESARAGEAAALEEIARLRARWERPRANIVPMAEDFAGPTGSAFAANAPADVLCWMRALDMEQEP
jgi:hypothetical protein